MRCEQLNELFTSMYLKYYRSLQNSNSLSSLHRRSKSPGKRSTSVNTKDKRKSMGKFPAGVEDGADALAGYTSYNQFQAATVKTDRYNI